MARLLMVAGALALACAPGLAHICLLNPPQRGVINVSAPGKNDCVRPPSPCGGVKEGAVTKSFVAGEVYDLHFQQNLNHYNPGNPGRIIVMLANHAPVSSQKDFTITLWEGSDYWAHYQGTQTNFTVPAKIPLDVECSHCVMQIRYHPNKPTEPVFHQCSDIEIKAPPAILALREKNIAPEAMWPPGFMFLWAGLDVGPASLEFTTTLFAVEPKKNGRVELLTRGSEFPDLYPVDGQAGYIKAQKAAVWLCGRFSEYSTFTAPHTLLVLTGGNKPKFAEADLTPSAYGMLQWDAIIDGPDSEYPLVFIGRSGNLTTDYYTYHAFLFKMTFVADRPVPHLRLIGSMTPSTDLYVNFMWAVCRKATSGRAGAAYTVNLIGGNENDLYKLTAYIYTLSFDKSYQEVESFVAHQNVTEYTLSNLFADEAGEVFAVSPGKATPLEGEFQGYTLVNLNTTSGDVNMVSPIGSKQLHRTWAGGVYGKSLVKSSMVYLFDGPTGFKNLAVFGRDSDYHAITLPLYFEEHKVFQYQLKSKAALWVTDFI